MAGVGHHAVPIGPAARSRSSAPCTLPNAGTCYADFNPAFSGHVRINGDYGDGDVLGTNPPSYIDRNAFVSAPAFTYGNTPRTLALRPAQPELLQPGSERPARLRLGGGVKLRLGIEVFNLFNTVVFGGINANITNANFGRVSSQTNHAASDAAQSPRGVLMKTRAPASSSRWRWRRRSRGAARSRSRRHRRRRSRRRRGRRTTTIRACGRSARGDPAEPELLRDGSALQAGRAARVGARRGSPRSSIAAWRVAASRAGACISAGACCSPIPRTSRSTCTARRPAAPPAKLNAQPLRRTTDFVDAAAPLDREHTWWVTPVVNGREQAPSERVTAAGAAQRCSRIAR